jgi:hypothetical protein
MCNTKLRTLIYEFPNGPELLSLSLSGWVGGSLSLAVWVWALFLQQNNNFCKQTSVGFDCCRLGLCVVVGGRGVGRQRLVGVPLAYDQS